MRGGRLSSVGAPRHRGTLELRACLLVLVVGCAGPEVGSTDGSPDIHPNAIQVTLQVSPLSIEPGERATLDWTARNALQVKLTANGADLPLGTSSVTSGSFAVGPADTTKYVITAHGREGRTAEASATLMVEIAGGGAAAAPNVLEFTASPGTLDRDSEARLSWRVERADTITITTDSGEQVEIDDATAPWGSVRHVPGESTLYVITATNAFGDSEAEAGVTVPLGFLEATVAPSAVAPGGSTLVSFRVQSASSVTLTTDREGDAPQQGVIDDDGRGEFTLDGITGRTALTLTATDGEETVRWTGEVGLSVPEIFEFEVAPQSVGIDEDVEVSWRTEGADSLEIVATDQEGEEHEVSLAGQSAAEGAVTLRPGDSTTYRLKAVGRRGESRREATVTVPTDVIELALVGSPVIMGGDVTVEYRVQGADDVAVQLGDGDPVEGDFDDEGRGSIEFEGVRQAATVTVVASRDGQESRQEVDLGIAPPAILSFDSSEPRAGVDVPVRLSWDVLGAQTLSLTAAPAVGPPVEIDISGQGARRGSVSVSPFLATTYTLRATSPVGEDSGETTVDVQLVIVELRADPALVPYGGATTVRFRVHGATSVQIDGDDVAFDASGRGRYPVERVTEIRTVELTAESPDDGVSQELEIRPAHPRVARFAASRPEVGIDDEVELSWELEGAVSLAIRAVPARGEAYDVDLGEAGTKIGSVRLTPVDSTTFTLTATNPMGDANAEASVAVPLQVLSLELAGSPAVLGGDVVLSARVQGAILIEVSVGAQGAVELDLAGDGRVEMTIENLQETQQIRFEAFDPDGGVTLRQLVAELRVPEVLAFASDPVQGGVGIDIELSWIVRGATAQALTAIPEGGESVEIELPDDDTTEVVVRPAVTTRYELTVSNPSGEVSGGLDLPVPLAILEFELQGVPVIPGEAVSVLFQLQGAVRGEVQFGERDPLPLEWGADGRGSIQIADVRAAGEVTVTATDGGDREQSRSGDVTLAAARVDTFVADPSPVHPGGTTTLSWTTTLATGVLVQRLPGDGDGEVVETADFADDKAAAGSWESGSLLRLTRFRLVATGPGGGTDSAVVEVTVVRDPTALRLSEVFYDAEASDDDHEWIELFNSGANPVNLVDVAIGYGGGSFVREVDGLPDLVVPPGGCVVVGGPVVDDRSFADAYDVELDFTPDIQNAGAFADGVALFNVVDGAPNAQTRPFDHVLYGPEVSEEDNFTGPDGEPIVATDIHDVDAQQSIARAHDGAGGGGWFEFEGGPTPGRCFGLRPRDFTDGDSQVFLGRRRGSVFGGDIIGLRTFGFDPREQGATVLFGPREAACFADARGMICTTPQGAGDADLVLSRPEGAVTHAAFYAYERIPVCRIAGFSIDEPFPGQDYVGTVSLNPPGALGPGDLTVESGWGPPDTDPSLTPDLWDWVAIAHLRSEEDGTEVFAGPHAAPEAPGPYLRTFRTAEIDGVFTYCANSPIVYSPNLLDSFTVSDQVPQ